MNITINQLKAIAPNANVFWVERIVFFFNYFSERYEVNTPKRAAAFFAQAAHETGGFTRFVENLNYSAARLQVVFPMRFPTPVIAKTYGGKPVDIANYIYANRMGNGSESSGDGWKYRGRGIFQLTGKNNYERFSRHAYAGDDVDGGHVLLARPEDVGTPIMAVRSALWFWQKNGLNELADRLAFESITKKINGGMNGIQERREYWKRAINAIK